MKKKLIGIVICMLISLPIFSITTVADPGTELEITLNGLFNSRIIFIQHILIAIDNIGDETSYRTYCDIRYSGGLLPLQRNDWNYAVGDIPSHTRRYVPFHDIAIYRFGEFDLTITVSADNVEPVIKIIKGFSFGFFWIINQN